MKFTNYTMFQREAHKLGLEYAVEHTLKMGFEAVEFLDAYTTPSIIKDVQEAHKAKKLLDSCGLTVSCFSMYTKLTVPDPTLCFDKALRNIEIAAELGSPYFHHTIIPEYAYPNPRLTYDEALEAVFERADRIVEHCGKYGITCLYEPQGIYMNGVSGLRGILEAMKKNHSNVGICGDTGNSLWIGVSPEDIYTAFAKDIKHIHVKDYVIKKEIDEKCKQRSISGECIYDVLPGEGIVDFKKLFSHIKGYTGNVAMEFVASDEDMRRSIEYIKGCF